jgi:hypothetical protein
MMVRTQYVAFWMFWVWLCGLALFLPGALVYVWDIVRLQGTAWRPAAAHGPPL